MELTEAQTRERTKVVNVSKREGRLGNARTSSIGLQSERVDITIQKAGCEVRWNATGKSPNYLHE